MILDTNVTILCFTAASLGLVHTILGPDHYVPFIVMSKAGKWSMFKTIFVTVMCGMGHVMSSVIIGAIGIALGVGVMKLEALEGFRGNLAAWLFIGFGFAYFTWGVRSALKNKPHSHHHAHYDKLSHSHVHSHKQEHVHIHEDRTKTKTPWILFILFIFGPCEPLIPVLMYPAAKNSVTGIVLVTTVFGVVTILTMLGVVMVSAWGMSFARFGRLERYTHALAGATICLSGLGIQFLGL